jgi:carbon-monoxide dehydrogenase medium subunit
MKQFEYFEPKSLKDACDFLKGHEGQCKILAGGTDLIVQMKEKKCSPNYICNIKSISELHEISIFEGKADLNIGSTITIHDVTLSELIKKRCPIIAEAAATLGSPQIRRLATIGGNICNASPAADLIPPLLCFDTRLRLVGRNQNRELLLKDFLEGPGITSKKEDEIITNIIIPEINGISNGKYVKVGRVKAVDLAIVSVALVLIVEPDDPIKCKDIRIALGAVAPTAVRAYKAESFARGQKITSSLIKEVANLSVQDIDPISDIRATASYRKEMASVWVRRTFESIVRGIVKDEN